MNYVIQSREAKAKAQQALWEARMWQAISDALDTL